MVDTDSPAVLRRVALETRTREADWYVEWYGRQLWPNAALGKDDVPAADVVVPGHCITVRQHGTNRRREYHTGRIAGVASVHVVFIKEFSARRDGHGSPDFTL